MKGKVVFGALLVSVALCGQGFGFELLDNLLGLNRGGCGSCQPAACEPAAVAACDPACEPACDPAIVACEPACGPACCKPCCKPRIRPVRDLFDGLEDLARCRLCGDCSKCKLRGACKPACNTACCEPAAVACDPVAACDPACEPAAVACCEPAAVACCEPAAVACDPVAACEPACGPACCDPCCKPKRSCKPRCRPVLDLLENLFGCNSRCPKPKKSCCGPMACAPAAVGCGSGYGTTDSVTPAPTEEEAAPLPPAPKADPSASIIRPRQLHTASRTLAQY